MRRIRLRGYKGPPRGTSERPSWAPGWQAAVHAKSRSGSRSTARHLLRVGVFARIATAATLLFLHLLDGAASASNPWIHSRARVCSAIRTHMHLPWNVRPACARGYSGARSRVHATHRTSLVPMSVSQTGSLLFPLSLLVGTLLCWSKTGGAKRYPCAAREGLGVPGPDVPRVYRPPGLVRPLRRYTARRTFWSPETNDAPQRRARCRYTGMRTARTGAVKARASTSIFLVRSDAAPRGPVHASARWISS